MHHRIITDNDKDKKYEITFDNGKSNAEKANIIFPIVEHLAKLKDHLKNKLESYGKTPAEGIFHS